MDLSICMIVKNEENIIGKCLEALTPLNAEIIVMDSGSSDKTKHIASQSTDKIYDFEWHDDFAAARNYAISKATYEYILIVDADEVLQTFETDHLEKLKKVILELDKNTIGRIICKSRYSVGEEESIRTDRLPRLFSKKYFEYSGVIHEQLVHKKNIEEEKIVYVDTELVFEHYGYYGNDEFIHRKTERNIRLLEKMYEKNPDDPYIIYQLGKSYFMRHDYKMSCDYFDKCLYYDLEPETEYVRDLIVSYGYSLINTKQYEKALLIEGVYNEFSSSCEYVFLMGMIYMNNGYIDNAIAELKKATTFSNCNTEGTNSYKAYYNLGVIYECIGDRQQAREYYKKCGNYEKAKQQLRKL